MSLLLAGWTVGHGVPIGEKARTTVAALQGAALASPLDATWLARRRGQDASLPSDAPPTAEAWDALSALPQFAVDA